MEDPIATHSKWVTSTRKTKQRTKKKSRAVLPPIPMNPLDYATQLSDVDKLVYDIFRNTHPITLSAEVILWQLPQHYEIQHVWRSLDSPIMRKYLKRVNKFDWCLVTE